MASSIFKVGQALRWSHTAPLINTRWRGLKVRVLKVMGSRVTVEMLEVPDGVMRTWTVGSRYETDAAKLERLDGLFDV